MNSACGWLASDPSLGPSEVPLMAQVLGVWRDGSHPASAAYARSGAETCRVREGEAPCRGNGPSPLGAGGCRKPPCGELSWWQLTPRCGPATSSTSERQNLACWSTLSGPVLLLDVTRGHTACLPCPSLWLLHGTWLALTSADTTQSLLSSSWDTFSV